MNILHNTKKTIQELSLEKNSFVLAVSGGPDSMCLISLFTKLKLPIVIAHFNHGIRGKESDKEEKLVEKYANTLKIPFYSEKWSHSHKNVSEDTCRKKRYTFLRKILKKIDGDFIVTGHHKNDQVETIFQHIVRGTGLEGYKGMKTLSQDIFRPLLSISKEEIIQYLKKEKIPYAKASDNKNNMYSRNRIRNVIIPEIEKINPHFTNTLLQNASLQDKAWNYLESQSNKWKKKWCKHSSDEITFPIKAFNKENIALKQHIVRSFFLDKTNLLHKHINEIIDLIESKASGKKKVFKKTTFSIEHENIVIFQKKQTTIIPKKEIPLEGKWKMKKNSVETRLLNKNTLEISINKEKITINISKLPEKKLFIRSWEQGDTFQPSGMKGHQKVQDFFVNNKIPLRQRKQIPIFVDNRDNIICIGTLRTSKKYSIVRK